jgi:hypothetical protein
MVRFCRSVEAQLNCAGNSPREGVAIHGPEARAAPAPTFAPFITSPALILLHPSTAKHVIYHNALSFATKLGNSYRN